MARLLVIATGPEAGDIISVWQNGHQFATMTDFEEFSKTNDPAGWSDLFFIIDCPEMSMGEAEALNATVMESLGPDIEDPDIPGSFRKNERPKHQSVGLLDLTDTMDPAGNPNQLERRSHTANPRRDTLRTKKKIMRSKGDLLTFITERS